MKNNKKMLYVFLHITTSCILIYSFFKNGNITFTLFLIAILVELCGRSAIYLYKKM